MFDKYRTADNLDNFHSIITNSTTGVYASNDIDLSDKKPDNENICLKASGTQN